MMQGFTLTSVAVCLGPGRGDAGDFETKRDSEIRSSPFSQCKPVWQCVPQRNFIAIPRPASTIPTCRHYISYHYFTMPAEVASCNLLTFIVVFSVRSRSLKHRTSPFRFRVRQASDFSIAVFPCEEGCVKCFGEWVPVLLHRIETPVKDYFERLLDDLSHGGSPVPPSTSSLHCHLKVPACSS